MPASSSLRATSRRVVTIVVLLALLLGLQPPSPVHAATYAVDRFDDAYSVWACTAAANDCTLRGAIRKAATTAEADTILLPEGTYYLSPKLYPDQPENEWGNIRISPNGDLTIQGEGNVGTIINASGAATGEGAIYYTQPGSGTLTLSSLRITDGAAGAIISLGSLSLDGVVLEGNSATGSGGGIYQWGSGQTLSLAEVTIRNNQAGQRGGGIYQYGGTLNITESEISDNHTTISGPGGGVFLDSSMTGFSFTWVRIVGNSTPTGPGGGVLIAAGSGTLSNVEISGNSAGSSGGGLEVANASTLTMLDSVISGNTAAVDGGGVRIGDNAAAAFERCTISGNVANSTASPGGGGGIYFTNSTVALTNSTVTGNSAKGDGGGLAGYSFSPGSALTMTSVTITANTADSDGGGGDSGGGLYVANGTATLVGSIIAGNDGVQCDHSVVGTIASNGHNLSSDASCELDGSGDLPSTAPGLGPLADNGGWNLTHALLPGSLAIDAGDAGYCPPTDQRGVTRPIGGNCDIGAYEAPLWVWLPLVFRQFP